MEEPSSNLILYGTAEPPQVLRSVQLGPLSLLYSCESLRRVSWHGTELVRGISWPVRDENWGTYPALILDEQIEQDSENFTVRLRFSVADGHLECQLGVTANASGEIRAEIMMTPVNGPFLTNRAGFTVLHPVRGTAGMPLSVTHSDGKNESSKFPQLISYDQPVMDIQRLAHTVEGAHVDITFEGEVFEMEDQRNWSDASYKTYCVPLVYPFTYALEKPVIQSVALACSGVPVATGRAAISPLQVEVTEQQAPQIGLVLEPGWTGDTSVQNLVAKTGVNQLSARFGSGTDTGFLTNCANLSSLLGAAVDVEIVLGDDEAITNSLHHAAEKMAGVGIHPVRVLALREVYLQSHQPFGPWPEGATPIDVCKAARSAFPKAQIGGGMMTNFTELNRCRPDPANCDYILHANTAIVHASDDLSVIETLESLPQIFESAEALAGGKPYRLGLVSIGMRTNPYGEDVADNPTQIRRTMARADPRQRGLFGAALAVGVLAATEGSAVEALSLAAPIGPFGIVYAPQDYPQVGFEESASTVYPLYHVVRAACEMVGARRLTFSGLSDGVAAYGVYCDNDNTRFAMFANITDAPQSVPMAESASIVVLGIDNFAQAVSDPDWLKNTERQNVEQLELGPFTVVFARWSD